MQRICRKPLSRLIADAKRLRAKRALTKEIVYGKKCSWWGWPENIQS